MNNYKKCLIHLMIQKFIESKMQLCMLKIAFHISIVKNGYIYFYLEN